MKLSKHDKTMVAMSWIVETFLNYLSQVNKSEDKSIPEHKVEQYDELAKNYETALEIVRDLNIEFSHEIDSSLGNDFVNQLVEITTRFTSMFATTDISTMIQMTKWIGMNTLVAKGGENEQPSE